MFVQILPLLGRKRTSEKGRLANKKGRKMKKKRKRSMRTTKGERGGYEQGKGANGERRVGEQANAYYDMMKWRKKR
jgi:hypothetical protein